jgi:predicted O-methyltransferase YrrM
MSSVNIIMSLNQLIKKYKLPDEYDDEDLNYPKWFNKWHIAKFPRHLKPDTKLIVELGSWVGYSSSWLAEYCPDAHIICIDTWAGSDEHGDKYDRSKLYSQFTRNMSQYRDRIIPLKMNTVAGLLELSKHNINKNVEFVYIDASHNYEDVICDLEMCHHLFPNAEILGDDLRWRNPTQHNRKTVMEALHHFCLKYNIGYGGKRIFHLKR